MRPIQLELRKPRQKQERFISFPLFPDFTHRTGERMQEGTICNLLLKIAHDSHFFLSVICGLTEETRPEHFVKAALEAVAFQTRDILEAMALDCGFAQSKLLVDGGMTANDYLMQIQTDYCGIPVGLCWKVKFFLQ